MPAGSPHAICVVLHVAPSGPSVLAPILDRRSELAVEPAAHGAPALAGHAYVAPPDHHLTVRDGRLELARGPLVNGVRPAADPLLRSLAESYGRSAVAVVLSGALGDGSLGARAVAEAGGRVLIQDPAEALVPSMPERAIAEVGTGAEVLAAAAIGERLATLGPAPGIAIRPVAEAQT